MPDTHDAASVPDVRLSALEAVLNKAPANRLEWSSYEKAAWQERERILSVNVR